VYKSNNSLLCFFDVEEPVDLTIYPLLLSNGSSKIEVQRNESESRCLRGATSDQQRRPQRSLTSLGMGLNRGSCFFFQSLLATIGTTAVIQRTSNQTNSSQGTI